MRADATPILHLDTVSRSYRQGPAELVVFRSASLTLMPGERVALVGPSGSGKSSLLYIAGLLEAPNSGRIVISGRDCSKLRESARTQVRRLEIGFVYQFHHLLPEFSALENVVMPQRIAGVPLREARDRAHELLDSLGLAERVTHRPAELSGGEQQRVALARAFANRPHLLLADEPTGNLDPENASHVFEQLATLVEREGLTVLMATHNLELARAMDRIIVLRNGELVDETDHYR
jgi:lipoprotein-releasing system ATP-binding protein